MEFALEVTRAPRACVSRILASVVGLNSSPTRWFGTRLRHAVKCFDPNFHSIRGRFVDAQLNILTGPFAGHTVQMSIGKFLIGRESDCQCILDDLSVSRHHCVLILDDWTLRVRDLGSTNGTLLNRRRIGPWEIALSDGDVVGVGSWSVRVELATHSVAAESHSAIDTGATRVFEGDTTLLRAAQPVPSRLAEGPG